MISFHESWVPVTEPEVLNDGSTVYVAFHPELIGIRAQAATEREARDLFDENLREYFSYLDENRMTRPVATHILVTGFEIFGGRNGMVTSGAATQGRFEIRVGV
jgi:hypothetical protein